ncbi:MAG: hypothetical protein OP8BY_0457 [Candidatus Saccharicenans subterraneus]|uniref:Uncharacterized protein n=1 Tax=Candidatus Saccharicenans subterraneus TaxID=2508984 RepID=A0A3E2BKT7_9BACT|nr:MAG: hypothetical protein OP8BY_0457 [Candidatus Saccharicenans subterraneum]
MVNKTSRLSLKNFGITPSFLCSFSFKYSGFFFLLKSIFSKKKSQ